MQTLYARNAAVVTIVKAIWKQKTYQPSAGDTLVVNFRQILWMQVHAGRSILACLANGDLVWFQVAEDGTPL